MKHGNEPYTCPKCGRTLEYGEGCNCDQMVRGLPRDGMRAKCPLFKCRSSYRGRYYIVCGQRKQRFRGCDERNDHYRRYCCDRWRECANIKDGGRYINECEQ